MPLSKEAATYKDKLGANNTEAFQHRHFATVAAIIATLDSPEREHIAQVFCSHFCLGNPRFDRARFLRACLVQS